MFLSPGQGTAQPSTILGKSFIYSVSLSKKIISTMKASHLFGLFSQDDPLLSCEKLIVAYKSKVAGVYVELPGLTKRREEERRLCRGES